MEDIEVLAERVQNFKVACSEHRDLQERQYDSIMSTIQEQSHRISKNTDVLVSLDKTTAVMETTFRHLMEIDAANQEQVEDLDTAIKLLATHVDERFKEKDAIKRANWQYWVSAIVSIIAVVVSVVALFYK